MTETQAAYDTETAYFERLRKWPDVLTPEEEAVFQWQYQTRLGLLGHFRQELWQAIVRADDDNLARLERGFPIEVRGFRAYIGSPGWWQRIEAKMRARGVIQ